MRPHCEHLSLRALTFALGVFLVAATSIAEDVEFCVTRDQKSNKIVDFVQNDCDFKVNVKWYDDGWCDTGCGTTVAPNGKESVTKARGSLRTAVCRAPKLVSRSWKGDGSYTSQ